MPIKLWSLLSQEEKKYSVVLLLLCLAMAFLDTLGVASIMPFIAVLSNPSIIETQDALNQFFRWSTQFGVETVDQFLIVLGTLSFLLLMLSLAVKALATYAQLRFTYLLEYRLGKRLLEAYLRKPYSWFLSRHSSELGQSVLAEVREVINKGFAPLVTLIAHSIVAAALVSLLIAVNPMLSVLAGLVLIISYGGVYLASREFLMRIGHERVKADKERYLVLNEAFGSFKEVKLRGLDNRYVRRFVVPASRCASHLASAAILGGLPRFALEGIAFGGMLGAILFLMSFESELSDVLPVISVFALAGYKLMPAMQQVYGSITQLRFAGSALDRLESDLKSPERQTAPECGAEKLTFQERVTFENVSFSYPKTDRVALRDVNLTIKKGGVIAVVGLTGSGKTTLIDLMLGLLDPTKGRIVIDGIALNAANLRTWQGFIGYVPQQIFLLDDTIAENIALGPDQQAINYAAVERAARVAGIHDFIDSTLAEKYHTKVGERGLLLSGGQRQRIGIARALYADPQIIVLDEATSALDGMTERSVFEALYKMGNDRTVVVISHNLESLKRSDTILLLDQGSIVSSGNFDELNRSNEQFRGLVAAKQF